jgi:hypothetical protein
MSSRDIFHNCARNMNILLHKHYACCIAFQHFLLLNIYTSKRYATHGANSKTATAIARGRWAWIRIIAYSATVARSPRALRTFARLNNLYNVTINKYSLSSITLISLSVIYYSYLPFCHLLLLSPFLSSITLISLSVIYYSYLPFCHLL